MRAAIFERPDAPLLVDVREVPQPGPGQVLIKVRRCGVCASDLHWTEKHAGTVAPGTILGHEFSGEVVLPVGHSSKFRPGDRVCVVPFSGCGTCAMCAEGQPFWCEKKKSMWGGFGQYTLASESSCVSLPDNLSWNDGALVEPLTSGLHAVRLANVRAGSTALVIGAGPIGLSCVYWLRRFNVASIVVAARSDRRKSVALAMGASSYIATGGKSLGEAVASSEWAPDFVFECAGARGLIDEAMRIVKRRGVVVVAGLCMQPDSFAPSLGILKELRVQFVGAYGVNDFRATVDALASGDLAPRGMISAIIPLEALPEQFEAMRTGSDHCKILVDPWSKGASNDE